MRKNVREREREKELEMKMKMREDNNYRRFQQNVGKCISMRIDDI